MWIIILSILIVGLVLLIVEIVFIPGTTVVGILGIVFSILGVVAGYSEFGDEVGFYIMMGTLITTAIALFFSFRSGAWRKFSLKDAITSKVNEGITAALSIGEEGVTLSSLRPSGKAQFQDSIFEVRTRGLYLEPKTKIKIISIDLHQILVEPVNP